MPHLAELTRQGVRFSSGYVTSPQCSPSRCGLLTGIYNQRLGHEHNGCMQAAFNAGAKTLAEHLRQSGYATAAYGKWHLGDNVESHHPTKHGFDEAWGYKEYTEAAKTEQPGFPVSLRPPAGNHAQNYATRAANFIEAHAAQPWFIYAAFHEPHVPVVPTPNSASKTQRRHPILSEENASAFCATSTQASASSSRNCARSSSRRTPWSSSSATMARHMRRPFPLRPTGRRSPRPKPRSRKRTILRPTVRATFRCAAEKEHSGKAASACRSS